MAAERSPGGKVCARHIAAAKKRVSVWEWINGESLAAAIILPFVVALATLCIFAAAHLVYWLQHL